MVAVADRCRGCAKTSVRPCFDLGDLPLAGGFLNGPEEIGAEEQYPLLISVCDSCGLVQIVDPVDPDILFQDYSFSTGTIPALVNHFNDYAGWLCERFNPKSVVEFGCNDGTLVTALESNGVRAVGIDISENITETARENGLNVLTGAFAEPILDQLRSQVGAASIVTGSNVFAHNADPEEILRATTEILAPDGVLCLEVMYAGDLRDKLQWDTLYHEHLTFYSLGTLAELLGRFGFEIVDAARIPMHGGSLRIAAARKGKGEPTAELERVHRWEQETGLNEADNWERFAADCRRKIDVFGSTMADLANGNTIWAYGAAGKATMWVNMCNMDYLGAVVDASPLRYGKLMPGTHTPIVSPDEFRKHEPDYVFVSAWNYLDNIMANEDWYRGAWVTPLPEMQIR